MATEMTYELRVGGSERLHVTAFEGTEAVNELYAFSVTVVASLGDDQVGALIGDEACLSWRRDQERRHVYGIVTRCEQVDVNLLKLELAPRARLMDLSRSSNIHQGESVVSVVQGVLARYHIPTQWRLVHDYPRREYITQYEETDLAFVQRLLAEAGIFFYFIHPEDPAQLGRIAGAVTGAAGSTVASAVGDTVNAATNLMGSALGTVGALGDLGTLAFAATSLGREVMVLSDSEAVYPTVSGSPEPLDRLSQLGTQWALRGIGEVTSRIPGGSYAEDAVEGLIGDLLGGHVTNLPFERHTQAMANDDDAVVALARQRQVHSLSATHRLYDPDRPQAVLTATRVAQHVDGPLGRLSSQLTAVAHDLGGAQVADAMENLGGGTPAGQLPQEAQRLMGGRAGAALPRRPLELYSHDARFMSPEWAFDGEEAARAIRSATRDRDLSTGESRCPWLLAGHRFNLHKHPLDALNRSYVVVRVRHAARGSDDYHGPDHYENWFDVVPDDVALLAPTPPRRHVQSCETATVVGDDGVTTNERGEIRARFHWDRRGGSTASTCWLRVMQPWSGRGFGTQFIPRPGSEVLIGFEGGDPDRPIAMGCVYNAACVPPFNVPERRAVSGIHTRSVPSGEGYNELSFDDRDDHERVYLHAERRLEVDVGEARGVRVVGDDSHTVGGHRRVEVTGDAHLRVHGQRDTALAQDDLLVVEGNARRTVHGASSEEVRGDAALEVQGAYNVTVRGGHNASVAGDSITRVSGSSVVAVGGEAGSTSHVIHVDGTSRLHASQLAEISSASEIVLQCGSSAIHISPDRISLSSPEILLQGRDQVMVAGDQVRAIAGSQLQGVGENVLWKSSGASIGLGSDASVEGTQVLLNSPARCSDEIEEQGTEETIIELVDDQGNPMGGQVFRIQRSDGSVVSGRLDDGGRASVQLDADGHITFVGLNDVVPA